MSVQAREKKKYILCALYFWGRAISVSR